MRGAEERTGWSSMTRVALVAGVSVRKDLAAERRVVNYKT